MVPKDPESLAMVGIGPGFRDHVDRARRSQFCGQIKGRLGDGKFLNRTGGNIFGGCADGFIAYIRTIHFDSGGAPESASKGDREIAHFRGIEISSVLNLHTRLKLREQKNIASVAAKILNLLV